MNKLKVLYDGECYVCYAEMKQYKIFDKKNKIEMVNIKDSQFDAHHYGLKDEEVNLHMHAIDEEGNVFKGVDSFIEIWKRIPIFTPFSVLMNNKLVKPFFKINYYLFAKYIRKKLPKRKCEHGCSL